MSIEAGLPSYPPLIECRAGNQATGWHAEFLELHDYTSWSLVWPPGYEAVIVSVFGLAIRRVVSLMLGDAVCCYVKNLRNR